MMTSRTVTSPAGERIEIVSDEDWIELTQSKAEGLRQWFSGRSGGKPYILAELWIGGKVVDETSGRATKLLYDSMIHRFPDYETGMTSITALFREPLNAPAFDRKTNGKRTYSIQLVALPDLWYSKLQAFLINHHLDGRNVTKPSTPEPIAESKDDIDQLGGVAQLVEESVEPVLEVSIASQVAMSLLTTVVEIISSQSPTAIDQKTRQLSLDLADVQGKLATRLSENDTLRKQLRDAGDMITALQTERDGLRQRLRSTEANLTAALKGDAAQVINGEIQRRVDEIMRTTPTPKGAD